MSRIRLTAKSLVANSYETLLRKLKLEYPKLTAEAREYKSGEYSDFVLHHLNSSKDNIIPTTDYNGNKIQQSKYLNSVLNYSHYTTKEQKDAYLKKVYPECENLKELWLKLELTKKELDDEIKDVVLIPKGFHGFLHGSERKTLTRASNKRELYQQFLLYKDTLTREYMLKLIKESRGSVSKSINTIKRVTDYLLYDNKKDKALDAVNAALDELEYFLK